MMKVHNRSLRHLKESQTNRMSKSKTKIRINKTNNKPNRLKTNSKINRLKINNKTNRLKTNSKTDKSNSVAVKREAFKETNKRDNSKKDNGINRDKRINSEIIKIRRGDGNKRNNLVVKIKVEINSLVNREDNSKIVLISRENKIQILRASKRATLEHRIRQTLIRIRQAIQPILNNTKSPGILTENNSVLMI